MKTFLPLLLILAAAPCAAAPASLPGGGNFRITPDMARFTYRPFEEGAALPCEHTLKDPEAQDWDVSCGRQKRYLVHLWVTAYTHETTPKMSYEILYWVTDMSSPQRPASSGATTWVHLKDPSALAAVETRQSVDNDTAGLYLELRFP